MLSSMRRGGARTVSGRSEGDPEAGDEDRPTAGRAAGLIRMLVITAVLLLIATGVTARLYLWQKGSSILAHAQPVQLQAGPTKGKATQQSSSTTSSSNSNPLTSVTGSSPKADGTKSSLPAWCKTADAIKICAHRALIKEILSNQGQAIASMKGLKPWEEPEEEAEKWTFAERVQVLSTKGIRCFDVDVSATREGFLILGHPDTVQGWLRSKGIKRAYADMALSELHELAGSGDMFHRRFPLLAEALHAFSQLQGASNLHGAIGMDSPLLFLDLKGATTMASLQFIAQQTSLLGIQQTTVVWFPSSQPETHGLLKDLREQQRQVLQAILGWQDSAPGVSPNASRVATPCEFKPDVAWDFQYLGPSHKCSPPKFWGEVVASQQPLAVWNVDSEEELDKVLQWRPSVVISNYPLKLKAMVDHKRDAVCRGVA